MPALKSASTSIRGGRRRGKLRVAGALLGAGLLLFSCGLQLLLLLVPAAGAVLLRLRTRESSLLLILVSGAVLGTCIFWLGVWALLRFLPGPAAALCSIAIVVGLAAANWWRDRSSELPALTVPSWAEAAGFALLFGVVLMSILQTSTGLVEFSETMIFHVPLVASMERGNVPPLNLQEPPHPLYYHYGQHALAAGLASLGRLPTPMALFVTNAWFGALTAAYAYVLGRRMRGIGAGLGAALLVVGAGTFNWVTALPALGSDPVSFSKLMNPLGLPFSTGNIAIGAFVWRVHGNSMAWAMCIALFAVDLSDRAMRTRCFEFALAAGVALAILAPANETLYGVMVAATGLLPLLWWLRRRRIEWSLVMLNGSSLLAAVALVAFTGGVMKTFFLEGSATHGASLVLDWKQLGTVASWDFGGAFPLPPSGRISILSLRFLQDVGPLPYLLVPALAWSFLRRETVAVHLAVSAVIAILLASILTLTRYPENTYRLVNLCVVLAAVPVGVALAALPRAFRSRAVRLTVGGAVGIVVALCVVSWPLLHVGTLASATYGRRWYPPPDGGRRYDPGAIEFLREHSEFHQGVLSIPRESWAVLGSGQFAPTGSYVGGRDEFRVLSSRAVEEVAPALMRELGVRYLYVERVQVNPRQRERIDQLSAAGELRQVWESRQADAVIYELATR